MTYEEFSNTLDEIGLSRKDFAEATKMNYSAVCGWSTRPIPGWVESWLDNYCDSVKFKKAKELFGCAEDKKPE